MRPATSIPCPGCGARLFGHEPRCPACGKRLLLPDWILPLAGFLVAGLFGLGMLASRDLKSTVGHRSVSPQEAYQAAQSFVSRQAGYQGPAAFTNLEEAEVQRWTDRRWRVTGQASMRDNRGAPVKVLYSCILVLDSGQWSLEEIRLENLR